jgi:50S ribosomal subunit-associated GTPase HflX
MDLWTTAMMHRALPCGRRKALLERVEALLVGLAEREPYSSTLGALRDIQDQLTMVDLSVPSARETIDHLAQRLREVSRADPSCLALARKFDDAVALQAAQAAIATMEAFAQSMTFGKEASVVLANLKRATYEFLEGQLSAAKLVATTTSCYESIFRITGVDPLDK